MQGDKLIICKMWFKCTFVFTGNSFFVSVESKNGTWTNFDGSLAQLTNFPEFDNKTCQDGMVLKWTPPDNNCGYGTLECISKDTLQKFFCGSFIPGNYKLFYH